MLWQIQFEIMKRNSQRHPKDSYSKIFKNSISLSFLILLRTESISISWIWMLSQIMDPQGSQDSHSLENFRGGLYYIWQHCRPQIIPCQSPDLFQKWTDNKPVRRLLSIGQAEGENRAIRGSECTCYILPFCSAPSFKQQEKIHIFSYELFIQHP